MNTRKIEITEKGTREYYKELVNITSQYRSLIKKPDMKLRNNFKLYKSYIIICAAFLITLLLMAVFWGADTMMVVGIILMVIVIAFCGVFLHSMNSMVNSYLADESPSILTLDDNGVELDQDGSKVVRLAWDNISFVRAFSESVCFFAKDGSGFIIGVYHVYKQEILTYLRSSKTSVKVIE